MTDRKPEQILRDIFYGSGKPVDTPVEIGSAEAKVIAIAFSDGLSNTAKWALERKPPKPTIYYKVKRIWDKPCRIPDPNGGFFPDSTHHRDYELDGCAVCDAIPTEYIYFYLYFPVDTAAPHKHDWTGGMLEVVDGVPKRLVCRSHWDMVVTIIGNKCRPFVQVSNGAHSLRGRSIRGGNNLDLDWLMKPEIKLHATLVELTDEHRAQIREYAKLGGITEEITWSGNKLITWARSRKHRQDYKDLCRKHGVYTPAPWWKIWAKRFPKPEEVFNEYPALFWAIYEVVYK